MRMITDVASDPKTKRIFFPATKQVLVRHVFILLLVVGLTLLPTLQGWTQEAGFSFEQHVLARVDIEGDLETLDLPIYGHLIDASGQEYVLTMVDFVRLTSSGMPFQILDMVTEGRRYYLALERRFGAREQASLMLQVLHDDGRRIVVRESPGVDDALISLGFKLKLMKDRPIVLAQRSLPFLTDVVSLSGAITPDPLVSEMIGQVNQGTLTSYVSNLSGVTSATIEGSPYTILTRHTKSGTPIQKATQLAFEHLQGLGLTTSYHYWTYGNLSNRNVIGELRGTTSPNEIVLIIAHIDDVNDDAISPGAAAPGADDNASGCAAVLMAADIMRHYQFNRTVRFVFFTGEEQGSYGSAAYADYVSNEDIVSVLNLDMLAFNTPNSSPALRLHIRLSGNPGSTSDRAIAETFSNVVNAYGLASALTPKITADGDDESDHAPFWDVGFAAVFVIEDDWDDFNPYWHTVNDQLNHLDLSYFNAFVKATVGTAAHLARPLNQPAGLILQVTKSGTGTGKVTSSDGKINCGTDCSETYTNVVTVTLSATTDNGSVFTGWSGEGCSGTAACIVTMDRARSVDATFTSTAGIVVTSPNGGENWKRGTARIVKWTYTGNPGTRVKIELLKGETVNRTLSIRASIGSSGSGSFTWRIPYTQTAGSDYRIRITSTTNDTYMDVSNNYFSITN